MSFGKSTCKAVSVMALAGALIGVGAGVATAATPFGSSAVGSSSGVHLYNSSADTLVLTAVSGDNEGVPPVGSTLKSGIGFQDFEVTFRAAKTTTVTADYDVLDATGSSVGSAVIRLSVDAVDDQSVSGKFTATGGSALPLKTGSTSAGFTVEGNSSTPIDVEASTPLAKALVNNYCDTVNTGATCTYLPSNRTANTQMNLLALGYTQPGGDNTPGVVSVSSGYNASTSDSWSIQISSTMTLANILSEGVSATYGQSVTWQHSFTAGDSIPVDPGYTGYIWGDTPVIQYTGTMQIKIGSSTYDITNSTMSTPDPTRTLTNFYAGSWLGNDPLNSPAQPPAGTQPLT